MAIRTLHIPAGGGFDNVRAADARCVRPTEPA